MSPVAASLGDLSPDFAAGYQTGVKHGFDAGYRAAERELAAAWHVVADAIARRGPTFTELECRRWGAGGRARFGEPRAGDYPGGPVKW